MSRDAPHLLDLPPPAPGEALEVAPGLLWMRFRLPFALNHVNLYAVDEGEAEGWALFDAGLGVEETYAAWEAALAGPLRGRRVSRLIVSHFHPDHVGAAGWLLRRLGNPPLHMTETEYLFARYMMAGGETTEDPLYAGFYRRHGATQEETRILIERGHNYLRRVTGLPAAFHPLERKVPLVLGGRSFRLLIGTGHAPAQAMLHCAEEGILLAADQVLGRITPNISVHAMEPEADPVARFLESLEDLRGEVPDETLVLPGHEQPLTRLHGRLEDLAAHHEARCVVVREFCGREPLSVAELTPLLFTRPLDPHQKSFAFAEALAHVNHLVARGEMAWVEKGEVWKAKAV
ncbi:MBL fold metallo-hydrolase [Neomegalonema sp.]|uniref:MBL fold metallo-hydrolase n=1 Tax=Neomegalonema sp. TaxID=2039713 RepID=UPI00261B80C4|nr:MBL fold metallo-hydrolase [Neomegalonema sp.]MDD2868594.1 MBL fold metallo-hydrolase [Neomegalonema sp.]